MPSSPASPAQARRAMYLLVAVAMAWGINWPVGKVTLSHLPPIWTVAPRSIVGTIALLVLCLLSRRLVLPRRALAVTWR